MSVDIQRGEKPHKQRFEKPRVKGYGDFILYPGFLRLKCPQILRKKKKKKNKPAVPVGVRRRAGTDPKEDEAMQDGFRCWLSQKDGN